MELTTHHRKQLMTANIKLMTAMISSCTCLTKTPQVQYHDESCKFRTLSEANEIICTILKETENKK